MYLSFRKMVDGVKRWLHAVTRHHKKLSLFTLRLRQSCDRKHPRLSFTMSDLCPVYAPFFSAMVRYTTVVSTWMLTLSCRVAQAPSLLLVSCHSLTSGTKLTVLAGLGAR